MLYLDLNPDNSGQWTSRSFPYGSVADCGLAAYTDTSTQEDMVLMVGGLVNYWTSSTKAYTYRVSNEQWYGFPSLQ